MTETPVAAPTVKPASYTRFHPVAYTVDCPCGATLAGDNVDERAKQMFEQAHAGHQAKEPT
jgi:hypothetical protein